MPGARGAPDSRFVDVDELLELALEAFRRQHVFHFAPRGLLNWAALPFRPALDHDQLLEVAFRLRSLPEKLIFEVEGLIIDFSRNSRE